MQQLSTLDPEFKQRFKRVVEARREADSDVAGQVLDILRTVKSNGDDALVQFTQRYDGYSLIDDADWRISAERCLLLLERDPTNARYRTLFHYHVTFPLAGVVLLLVGLPFVLGQERGKAGERVGKGFFLCVAYFGFEFVTRTLGLQGGLGPLFASWLPVISFGALGLVLFSGQRS